MLVVLSLGWLATAHADEWDDKIKGKPAPDEWDAKNPSDKPTKRQQKKQDLEAWSERLRSRHFMPGVEMRFGGIAGGINGGLASATPTMTFLFPLGGDVAQLRVGAGMVLPLHPYRGIYIFGPEAELAVRFRFPGSVWYFGPAVRGGGFIVPFGIGDFYGTVGGAIESGIVLGERFDIGVTTYVAAVLNMGVLIEPANLFFGVAF